MAIAKTIKQWALWSLLERILGVDEVSQVIGLPEELQEEFKDVWQDFIGAAIKTSRLIGGAGKLEILGCQRHLAGFFTLEVCSSNPLQFWLVDVFPEHLKDWGGSMFEVRTLTHIEFEFSEEPITTALLNSSSRLRIKAVWR